MADIQTGVVKYKGQEKGQMVYPGGFDGVLLLRLLGGIGLRELERSERLFFGLGTKGMIYKADISSSRRAALAVESVQGNVPFPSCDLKFANILGVVRKGVKCNQLGL